MCITPRLMLFLNSADAELNGKKKIALMTQFTTRS